MLFATVVALLLALVAGYFLFARGSATAASQRKLTDPGTPPAAAKVKPAKAAKVDITAKLASRKGSDVAPAAAEPEHALVHRHLRGHQGDITGMAVSSSGRYIATVAADETLRLWTVVEGEKNAPFARHNLPKGQHGSAVAISADEKYVLMAVAETRTVSIFGIKPDETPGSSRTALTPLHSFPTPHKAPIRTLLMAPNNTCIVSMAEGASDLPVHVFTAKGTLIQTIPVAQLLNYSCAISDDSRFLAIGTKLPDTRIFELVYRKDGKGSSSSAHATPTLEKLELAMTLKGQQRGIKRMAFGSPASGLLVTASVDGSFYEHSLQVQYARREDPKLRARTVTDLPALDLVDVMAQRAGREGEPALIAMAAASHLQFWASGAPATTAGATPSPARLLASIPQAHKGAVTALAFNRPAPGSNAPVHLVTAGEGKTVTLWNLPRMQQ